jgi:arylsulfatase
MNINSKNIFIFGVLFLLTLSLAVIPSFKTFINGYAQTIGSNGQDDMDTRPNIMLFIGDDFGYSDIGVFGGEISTPNLDNLAKDGKILTNYHTVPVCSPARVALLTGVDHHIGGIGSMYELIAENQKGKPGYETWINDRVVTVAQLLHDSGYHTYLSGKWHLSGNHFENGTWPYDKGFEQSLTLLNGGANHFNDFPEIPLEKITFAENDQIIPRPGNKTLYSNELYTDKMIEYLKNSTTDGKPFFAYLTFQVAHSPFQSPQESVAKYEEINSVGWDKIREQRFEKQQDLGFWSKDMKLPDRIPPNQPWEDLTEEQKDYASRILAVRAAMIENMDQNIGKVIQYLKDTGKYDNTLIVFISDNGTSEPAPMLSLKFSSANAAQMENFTNHVNNTLPNLGNGSSIINYAAWGTATSDAPLSGFKTSEYEGGTRVPFIFKEPVGISSASSSDDVNPEVVKTFAYVNDLAPTFLEYAGVQHPGSSYNGMPVHPIMGKSLKSLFNGTSDSVYGPEEIVTDEMFNNTAVYMGGEWKAIKHEPPMGDGKWQLHNIVNDPTEIVDLAEQRHDIMEKLINAYDEYAKDVGVVIPRGQAYYEGLESASPPINNQSQVTISSADIIPEQFSSEAPLS